MKLNWIVALGVSIVLSGCGSDHGKPGPTPVTPQAPAPVVSNDVPANEISVIYQDSSWFREVSRKLNVTGANYIAESGVVLPSAAPDVVDLRFQTPDGISSPDAIEYTGAYACGVSNDLTHFTKMNTQYLETAPAQGERLFTKVRVLELGQSLAACPGQGVTLAIKVRKYPERTLYRVYLISVSLESSS